VNEAALRTRIEELTGRPAPATVEVLTDTGNYMGIWRGHVVELQGRYFLVKRDMREGRFGIDDQPKFWVKKAVELESGRDIILKLVFEEEFQIRIGLLRVRCYRSGEKESRFLREARGDDRFMQGETLRDARGNAVRVIDFIPGPNLYGRLSALDLDHETYTRERLPEILASLRTALGGISEMHARGLVHGDIRNDHLILDPGTGGYRWIDFDLCQDISDFDVWSLGNILLYAVGKGEHTFQDVRRGRLPEPTGAARLTEHDASAFFAHRIMNLRKLFPWVPEPLNDILMHFSFGTTVFYESVEEVLRDLDAVLGDMGAAPARSGP
jgi:hypothetical protein